MTWNKVAIRDLMITSGVIEIYHSVYANASDRLILSAIYAFASI